MKTICLQLFFLLSLLSLVATSTCLAQDLKPGDPFPGIVAEDQFEAEYSIPEDTRYIVVTFSMGAGKKANKYFAAKGASYLPEHKAVLINDIHPMPGIG